MGKDLEGTSLPRMAELQGVCARARAHTVYVQVHLCACVHLCVHLSVCVHLFLCVPLCALVYLYVSVHL